MTNTRLHVIMSEPDGADNTIPALTTTHPSGEGHAMANADSTVEYCDIPDCPGYRAGSDGTIWSCLKPQGRGRGRHVQSLCWKQLRPSARAEDGRKRYTVRRSDGTYRRCYASHLVLEAFVGVCPDGMEACHDDGNCLNDSSGNLRWDTHQSNLKDRVRHGTHIQGEEINTAKLTADDVREIRRVGKPLKQHAVRYGVSEALVSAIIKRKVWKHVA